jgi:type VI secretion system protein
MWDRTLLERLERGARGAERRAEPDVSARIESVLRHLDALFNAHRGSALTRPDYGVPDFNDLIFDFPSAVPRLARIIEEQIRAFEPRLENCSVRPAESAADPLALEFVIAASLVGEEGRRINLATTIGTDGRFRVRS